MQEMMYKSYFKPTLTYASETWTMILFYFYLFIQPIMYMIWDLPKSI